MNSLSKREKTLIYILVCMIIFIGGIFLLVLPSFEQYSKAKSAYDEASDQLVITKASVPDYTTLDANVKKVKKELEAIRKNFYEEMNKEDLDQEITQLVVEHNLVPVNLSMSEIASEEVMNYETYLKSQTKEQSTSSTENKTETTKKTTAKVYNVTMVVQGTVQNVQSLVNDANKTYSMKIGSVQYSEQQEDTKQMTITFKVYMM